MSTSSLLTSARVAGCHWGCLGGLDIKRAVTPDTKSGCCMKRAAMWYSRWKVSMMDQFLPVRIWRRATFREVGERSEMVWRVFCAHSLTASGALVVCF